MAAHCVNRSSEEFKNLLKELNSSDVVGLAADISIWQEINGIDKFPTKSELVELQNSSTLVVPTANLQSDKKTEPVKDTIASKLTAKDIYGKRYITRVAGSNTKFRVLKDWKAKALQIIKSLESQYPGMINHKNVNGEIIITVSEQSALRLDTATAEVATDTKLRGKYFSAGQTTTTMSILDKIARSNHPLNKLAEKLKRFGKQNNVTIVLKPVKSFEEVNTKGETVKAAAYYDPNTNTIHIAEFANFRENSEVTILHEIMHSITYHQLRTNTKAAKDFQMLYEYALTKMNQKDFYGLKTLDEFIVALFTDARFIRKISKIPASNKTKYTNLFQELFDYILSFLKIGKTNSLYEEAFSVATHVLHEFVEVREDELASMQVGVLADQTADSNSSKANNSNNSKTHKAQTYSSFKKMGKMPFQDETLSRIKSGKQKVTIRTSNFTSGNYTIDGETYNILNLGRKNISQFKNKEALMENFKGDSYEEGKYKHIDGFFAGSQNLYVYQITKLSKEKMKEPITLEPILETTEKAQPIAPAFQKQYVYIKRKIKELRKRLDNIADKDSAEYIIAKAELDHLTDRLVEATVNRDFDEYTEMGKMYLAKAEAALNNLPKIPSKITRDSLVEIHATLEAFKDFGDLSNEVVKLRNRMYDKMIEYNLININRFNTSGNHITVDDVNAQIKDIRWSAQQFGSLSDIDNHLAYTIGAMIKAAQNKASTANKHLEALVQAEVNKLKEYAKANNMSLEDVYELLLEENTQGYLNLVKPPILGATNAKYDKVMNTPALKNFYLFYQKTLKDAEMNLPYKVGKFYVLNKEKSALRKSIDRIIPVESLMFDSFVSNEELLADIVPDKFRVNIPADKKDRDLGSGLLQFAAYANNHNALSEVLPEVRLLQEQLKYERNSEHTIAERQFVSSSSSDRKVNASDSNIYKMVNSVIDMQLKGKMTKYSHTPFKKQAIKDPLTGKIIGYKVVRVEDLIDMGLTWNSLLRIGLSPITAICNVSLGEIGNFMEGVGGKHFTVGELHKATKIFFKQIDYTKVDKSSNVYQWLALLNPLQELTDYDIGDGLKADPKKITVEKALEKAYFMQKKGELYLQTRTMLAVLIHEGYMKPDGTNTGKEITEDEIRNLSNKVQKINQMIHGRYSQREAATASQSALFRAAFQFRKWIPAAIEARFGDYKAWDQRLMTDTEGRYVTFKNKVLLEIKEGNFKDAFENIFLPIISARKALEKGNMTSTEIYNMRKNITEVIIICSLLLLYAGLRGDDDDKDRRRQPLVKLGLTLLDRLASDTLFFLNAKSVTHLVKNTVPMAKLMDDLLDVGKSIPHAFYLGDYKIKKGSQKGNNEFYTQDLPEVIPGLAVGGEIYKLVSSDIYREFQ